ncbi:CGNR zinc finger domain-containing protein [Nonomuraea jiangxiensis]|uniref:Putative stress-induced transcription regulator n=1 Tax=Nonomuraea jiangxiensis TaxID=633440 RepID=A0A1G8PXZ2_9ACTN|nr:CGNR zinc finger domain-containing protein [Nonomuraea jiangxiensis]SDI97303.1 Putative stress-induced transcription regulator [Nonomuraea jiangxiensis]
MRQFAETGLVAIDLANTWDEWLDDPERLPDVAALHRFCAELNEPFRIGTPTAELPDLGDLEEVREVRERLRAMLACDPPERTRALARWVDELPLRALVQDSSGTPRLRLAAQDGTGLADRIAVRAVAELLDIAASGDWERLRLCAAGSCEDVFVDRSRPGRRQFCSTRCANRAHAAASRARHR